MTLQRVAVTPEVGALLALAMWPDPERIGTALGRYAHEPELQVWAWMQEGTPLCAAGLRLQTEKAEVLHLGTLPTWRGQGHARRLLKRLLTELNLTQLQAETDDDSVGFYRRAGFDVREAHVQERQARGGHRRYLCTLSR